MSDEELITLFFLRSEDAIHETAKKYGRYCYTISYDILKNKEDAEECVNDAYLKLWNSIPPHSPKSLLAYLSVIVRNIALSRYEYYAAKKRNVPITYSVVSEMRECIPDRSNIEESINSWFIAETVEEFLTQLSENNRNIFICRYWLCLSIKEICQKLNLSENIIKVSLHRSRIKLKRLLLERRIF